jgi:hypothetical protein
VRFGWFYDVNRGGGAEPRSDGNRGKGAGPNGRQKGNRTTFVIPADETGIDTAPGGPNGNIRIRFFAKREDTGRSVRGSDLTNEPTVFSQGSGVKSIGSVSNIATDEAPNDVAAVGPVTAAFNDSGRQELPYLTGPDKITIGDETRIELGDSTAKTQKTRLGVGSWDGSETSVFYVGSDGSTIYRVTPGGSPVELATPDNGVSAVISPADIDGDSGAELPFVDGSQQLRYVKTSDDPEQTFTKVPNGGVGANNNVGVGDPADLDLGDDETAKVPIVDGSSQIRLVDADGVDITVISGSDDEQAAKAPLAARDVDRDGSRELVYLENNNSPVELKYVDDVGGANEFKLLHDSNDDPIRADTDIGVV